MENLQLFSSPNDELFMDGPVLEQTIDPTGDERDGGEK